MLNLFLTRVPLERLKYSSRTENFQPFFETQISLLSATIHFHEKSHLSGSEKGRLGLLEMYFHEWVFCEMAQFEENFDFWT